jgi:hypothetical protein
MVRRLGVGRSMLQTLMNEGRVRDLNMQRLYIWDIRIVSMAFGNRIGRIEENNKVMMSEDVKRLADRFEIDRV